MTTPEIMDALRSMGSASVKRLFENHGNVEHSFGVKIGDLKTIQKKLKKNHALSLELFDTGNTDARYLAGLIADEKQITADDLRHWLRTTRSAMILEYTIPWVAAESRHGWALGTEWIDASDPGTQAVGWSTLSSVVSLVPDDVLDIAALRGLLDRVEHGIGTAQNRVRYVMNGFVIAVGCYVAPLSTEAMQVGKRLGKISVDLNGTACKVPDAPGYIQKVAARGTIGKKKKMARC
ncbi:MAG: alkylation repair protein [Flaviaesturariibacter sp.]|nr:alkylation repair protein [Flaviaesturariibacter sp.]